MTIDELLREAHAIALSKGWWDAPNQRTFGELIALAHSELSEALEEWRNGHPVDEVRIVDGKPEGVPVELADLCIRIADTCAVLGIDLDAALRMKMDYNRTRPYRHGGKVA